MIFDNKSFSYTLGGEPFQYSQGKVTLTGFAYNLGGELYPLLGKDPPAIYVNYCVPISDINAGSWTTSPLYPKIDELLPDNTDYISSPYSPNNNTCEVLLNNLGYPNCTTGHIVLYNFRKEVNGGELNLTVELYQGATLISGKSHSNINSIWTTGSFTLQPEDAARITDYSDLRLRFTANQV